MRAVIVSCEIPRYLMRVQTLQFRLPPGENVQDILKELGGRVARLLAQYRAVGVAPVKPSDISKTLRTHFRKWVHERRTCEHDGARQFKLKKGVVGFYTDIEAHLFNDFCLDADTSAWLLIKRQLHGAIGKTFGPYLTEFHRGQEGFSRLARKRG